MKRPVLAGILFAMIAAVLPGGANAQMPDSLTLRQPANFDVWSV